MCECAYGYCDACLAVTISSMICVCGCLKSIYIRWVGDLGEGGRWVLLATQHLWAIQQQHKNESIRKFITPPEANNVMLKRTKRSNMLGYAKHVRSGEDQNGYRYMPARMYWIYILYRRYKMHINRLYDFSHIYCGEIPANIVHNALCSIFTYTYIFIYKRTQPQRRPV